MSTNPLENFRQEASPADEPILVDISYRIIQQVSSQLYTNPRRAIEELVCNSYDAEAEECYVETPKDENDVLLVLDNGESMDFEGLEWLWTVAESPKTASGPDRVSGKRKQIGKFGVGKLAAYALGEELTHIAHTNGTTRAVSVDEGRLEQEGRSAGNPPDFPVYELTESESRDLLSPYFEDLPNPYDEGWESWTLAIVGDLHEDSSGQALQPQYLDQMIRTSIPITSDFTVYRDGKEIEERDVKYDTVYRTGLLAEDFRDQLENDLRSFWKKRLDLDDLDEVPKEKYRCWKEETEHYANTEEIIEALHIPELGPVTGEATIYEGTLTSDKREERGFQDHGFKVTVKGKHLNRHDPLFGISQRSHRYWNRFIGDVEIPGLDEAILVQRNDVNENKVETQVSRRLLKSLFNFARTNAEDVEEKSDYEPKSFGERLGIYSPFDMAEAVEGLTGEYPSDDLDEIDIKATSLNEEDRPVVFQDDTILVNEEHPFFQALSEERGYSNFRKTISEAIAGNLLTKGYFSKHGVEGNLLDASEEMYDDVLRSAASYYRDQTAYLIEQIEETSYEGDDPFERAIVAAFRSMKIASRHYGASGDPDGIISIRKSQADEFRVSIEAKGVKDGKRVSHTEARPSSVARHRDGSDCNHSIIVAREFQLSGNGDDDSVFLEEIRREDGVTLMRVDAIKRLLELQSEKQFSFSQKKRILEAQKHPDEMPQFIKEVWDENPDNDLLKVILEEGWDLQQDGVPPSAGYLSSIARVREIADDDQDGVEKEYENIREQIAEVIRALRPLTGNKVKIYDNGYEFELEASPQAIVEEMSQGADDLGTHDTSLDKWS